MNAWGNGVCTMRAAKYHRAGLSGALMRRSAVNADVASSRQQGSAHEAAPALRYARLVRSQRLAPSLAEDLQRRWGCRGGPGTGPGPRASPGPDPRSEGSPTLARTRACERNDLAKKMEWVGAGFPTGARTAPARARTSAMTWRKAGMEGPKSHESADLTVSSVNGSAGRRVPHALCRAPAAQNGPRHDSCPATDNHGSRGAPQAKTGTEVAVRSRTVTGRVCTRRPRTGRQWWAARRRSSGALLH